MCVIFLNLTLKDLFRPEITKNGSLGVIFFSISYVIQKQQRITFIHTFVNKVAHPL